MTKVSLTLYYDAKEGDLKRMIKQLAKMKESRFYERSISEVAAILLRETLEKELSLATSATPSGSARQK